MTHQENNEHTITIEHKGKTYSAGYYVDAKNLTVTIYTKFGAHSTHIGHPLEALSTARMMLRMMVDGGGLDKKKEA